MKKMKFLHSLKFRLFVILVIVGILPNIILRIGILKTYENRAVSNRSIDILSQAKMLGNQIVTYNYIQDTSSEVINTQLELLSNIYDGRVLIINNGFQVVKDTYGLDTGKTIISEEVVKSSKGQEISKYDSKYRYIEMTIPLKDTLTNIIPCTSLVLVSFNGIVISI